MPEHGCKGLCDCLGRDCAERSGFATKHYVCATCQNILPEPAAYCATVGTRELKFRTWSFCCWEHYVTRLRGY